jgi:hypothetical protein
MTGQKTFAGILGDVCDGGGGGLSMIILDGYRGVGVLAGIHGYEIVGHVPGIGGDDDCVLDIIHAHVLITPAASVHGHWLTPTESLANFFCGGCVGAGWTVGRAVGAGV